MKLASILLASTIALVSTWSAAVLSFTEVGRSFSQLVDLADVILIGTVTDSAPTWGQGQQASSIFTVVTLDDLEVIKGSVSGATYAFRHVGGRMGDVLQFYEGMPRLKVGTRYLLFIPGDTNVLFPTVGISQGIFIVAPRDGGPAETIQTVARATG